MYSEKERNRPKKFVSQTGNKRVDLTTFSSFKSKERKKKEEKDCRERHLCLRLSAGDIASTLNICLVLTY